MTHFTKLFYGLKERVFIYFTQIFLKITRYTVLKSTLLDFPDKNMKFIP